MKKTAISLIFLLMLFTLSSCKENNIDPPVNNDDSYVPEYNGGSMNASPVNDVKGSIHQYDRTETDEYLFKNNSSDYKVLVPKDASIQLVSYVKEFVNLFEEATNYQFEIVEDSNMNSNSRYISIGNTEAYLNSNITLEYEQIKSQGYIIKTVNNNIYINAFTDQGCLNGIYQLLNFIANYRYLGPETYILNTGLKEVKLYNYDVIDAPDIEYRLSSYSFVTSEKKYRLTELPIMPVNGLIYHNSFAYFPKSEYQDEHPEWYSTDGTQLCYTARGNEESLKLMQDTALEIIKEHLIAYPDKTALTFTIEDSNTFCDCDTCRKSNEKYNGSNAAVIVKFLNVISDRIEEWFNNEGSKYKRNLQIVFFAYLSTNLAPAYFDETLNKYVPVDQDVVCRSNVCPFVCDIRGDYTKSYYDTNSANLQYANSMRAWSECADNLYFWTYSTNFHHYLTPYNSFDAMLDSYKFAVEVGTNYIFDQGQFNQGQSATGWSFLKQYLTSRATWDCNVKASDLYDEFFSEFYSKEASSIMRELFDEYKVVATYQSEVLDYNGAASIYHNPYNKDYWSKQTLLRWLDRFDDALAQIEIYKESSPGLYQKYYGHITSERAQYSYLLLKTYGATLSTEELEFYKDQFHKDSEGNGMLYENELRSPISNILK